MNVVDYFKKTQGEISSNKPNIRGLGVGPNSSQSNSLMWCKSVQSRVLLAGCVTEYMYIVLISNGVLWRLELQLINSQ